MPNIPVYMKSSGSMQRPQDSEFYLLTAKGLFFCRNHRFFRSDVPAHRLPHWLADHQSGFSINYPKVPQAALEFIVGFFGRVYELHGSEAIALLYWDLKRQRYRIRVPQQVATVWQSSPRLRTALDVKYEVPNPPNAHCLLVASIHSHADGEAYSSWTDRRDEQYRDGIHVVCGRIDREPPSFHLELAIDNHRFALDFGDFFQGYDHRREFVPQDWLRQLNCKIRKPQQFVLWQNPGVA